MLDPATRAQGLQDLINCTCVLKYQKDMIHALVSVSRLSPPPPEYNKPKKLSLTDLANLYAAAQFQEVVNGTFARLEQLGKTPGPEQNDLSEAASLWVLRVRALLNLGKGIQVATETRACLSELPRADFLRSGNNELWDLAILVTPVFQHGYNEAAIKELFRYAMTARTALLLRISPPDRSVWTERLKSLHLHIVGILLGLKDYTGALHLLQIEIDCLEDQQVRRKELIYLSCLILVQLGEAEHARALVGGLDEEQAEHIKGVCDFIDDKVQTSIPATLDLCIVHAVQGLFHGDTHAARQLIAHLNGINRRGLDTSNLSVLQDYLMELPNSSD